MGKFIDIRDIHPHQDESKAWVDLLLYFIDRSLKALYSFHPSPDPIVYVPKPCEQLIQWQMDLEKHDPYQMPLRHKMAGLPECTFSNDFPLLELVVAAKDATYFMGRTSNPLVHRLNLQKLPTQEQLVGIKMKGDILERFPELLIK